MELICYLSNGYPTLKDSTTTLSQYADAGCTMIEIDLPARNPFMESSYIAARMRDALAQCSDYKRYMDEMEAAVSRFPKVRFLILVYERTVMEIGLESFAQFCLRNHFMDVILVGSEREEVKQKLMEQEIRISCYVRFQLPEDEVEHARKSNGFVYLQAKPDKDQMDGISRNLEECIHDLKKRGIDRPIYCGVGISSPEDVRMVKSAGGDAAFVGSAVLKLQENPEEMKALIQRMKAEC